MAEYWDLYDADRHKTKLIHNRAEPIPSDFYHLVVSVWIRNSDGKYLLSQRNPDKEYPLLWECTGGSALAGENSLQAAIREVKEELGISLCEKMGQLIYQIRRNQTQDFYDVWLFELNSEWHLSDCVLQETEVIDVKWASKEQIADLFHSGCLHPLLYYFENIIP